MNTPRTQEQVNQWFKDNSVKNAMNLLDIDKLLSDDGLELPNNVVVDKSGVGSIDFIRWYENKIMPTSFEECCNIIGIPSDIQVRITHKEQNVEQCAELWEKINTFVYLIICRNAYWKVYEDWKPDWNSKQHKYVITNKNGNIHFDRFCGSSHTFAFPTIEMRYKFFLKFNNELNKCLDLI